jgi:hypothetical protein
MKYFTHPNGIFEIKIIGEKRYENCKKERNKDFHY